MSARGCSAATMTASRLRRSSASCCFSTAPAQRMGDGTADKPVARPGRHVRIPPPPLPLLARTCHACSRPEQHLHRCPLPVLLRRRVALCGSVHAGEAGGAALAPLGGSVGTSQQASLALDGAARSRARRRRVGGGGSGSGGRQRRRPAANSSRRLPRTEFALRYVHLADPCRFAPGAGCW